MTVASNEYNFVVRGVRIGGDIQRLGLTLLLLPVLDELADFGFEIDQKTFGAARTLKLLTQLLGNDTRGCGLCSYNLRCLPGFSPRSSSLALRARFRETSVPERGEVVGDVADGVRRADLPVALGWGLRVRVVQEAI